jgi:restriction endonuclease Mrr
MVLSYAILLDRGKIFLQVVLHVVVTRVVAGFVRQIGLSEADRDELLPSGKQRKFDNRVSWARTYLQKAQVVPEDVSLLGRER